jgi:hypothetical protein
VQTVSGHVAHWCFVGSAQCPSQHLGKGGRERIKVSATAVNAWGITTRLSSLIQRMFIPAGPGWTTQPLEPARRSLLTGMVSFAALCGKEMASGLCAADW